MTAPDEPCVCGTEFRMTHDEIAEVAFHVIVVCREGGVTDPLRIAHAIAVAIKLAEDVA